MPDGGLVAAAALVGTATALALDQRRLAGAATPSLTGTGVPGRTPGLLRLGGGVCAATLVLLGPTPVALLGLALGLTVFLGGRRAAARARRHAEEVAASVADLVGALAADLTAGRPPLLALADLGDECLTEPTTPGRVTLGRSLSAVVASARLGGDLPSELRRAAGGPGAGGLRALAAAWDVADRSGTALSGVLDRVVDGLAEQRAAQRSVEVSLAGARATARLLAALPLLGLALGTGLGGSPVAFLLTTSPGRACLLGGLALDALGLIWTDRLAQTARGRDS